MAQGTVYLLTVCHYKYCCHNAKCAFETLGRIRAHSPGSAWYYSVSPAFFADLTAAESAGHAQTTTTTTAAAGCIPVARDYHQRLP